MNELNGSVNQIITLSNTWLYQFYSSVGANWPISMWRFIVP